MKGVEWKPGTLEFVTRRGEGSVHVWWIVNAIGAKDLKDIAADDGADDVVVEREGKGVFLAQLVWGFSYPVLMGDEAQLLDVVGLGDVGRFLLKQRGVLDWKPPLAEDVESENELEEE